MQTQTEGPQPRAIRINETLRIFGGSKSQLYALVKAGKFPAPIKISARSSAWIEHEVLAWLSERIAASRKAVP